METVSHDGDRWSNAATDRVEIVEYNPDWPAMFDAEAVQIRRALPWLSDPRLEHFGSTAIPGLAAKPIIDMILIDSDLSRWPRLVSPLEALGYIYWAENPRKDRMFFVRGMPPYGTRRSHHLHVRVAADATDEILFRDLLRKNAGAARSYEVLKRDLAQACPTDRDLYTARKAEFITGILSHAKLLS